MNQDLDSATRAYVVTLIATPATTLPFEVFCQEAVARTAAIAPQFGAYPCANHFPAIRGGEAYTTHHIQVWDSSKPGALGVIAFSVQDTDPIKCLYLLGRELAALKAKLDYDAATPSIAAPELPTAPSAADGNLPF